MTAALLTVHVISAIILVILVLLHAGRGGGLSGMFGGGMGGGLSGSSAVEKNLDRITVVASVIFGITTILLVMTLK
ncbi:MAG TPA: preprotein translocase subunit SecG [Actinomycetota bacterium]|nr:preprotein translocase subunit SecG [Actinomycetota bacterium]